MNEPLQEKRRWGPGVFIIIILADLVIIVWGRHIHKQKQLRYDNAGLNLAKAPAAPRAAAPSPRPAPRAAPTRGGLEYLIKDKRIKGVPAAARGKRRSPGARSKAAKAEQTGPAVSRAKSYFYALKNSSRFRNSKVLKAWRRDFLSYPDLNAINAAYQKDRNAVQFVIKVVRSPSFSKLAGKYLVKPDVQTFIMKMTTSKSVMASTGIFFKDAKVEEAVDRMILPGVGNVGSLRGKRSR